MPTCVGWCGQCYSNVRGRTNTRGHRGYRSPPPVQSEGILVAIKKRQAAKGSDVTPVSLDKSLFAKNFPDLYEFLSLEVYEDGSQRQTATITLFVSASGYQACLNDRDQGQATFVTSASVDGLWAALDKGLREDTLAWRPSQAGYGKKRRK